MGRLSYQRGCAWWLCAVLLACPIGCGEQEKPDEGGDEPASQAGDHEEPEPGPPDVLPDADEAPVVIVPEPTTPSAPPLAAAKKWGDHYYLLVMTEDTWDRAQEKCARLGGHLVWIESQEENDYVVQMLARWNIDRLWIGARETAEGGTWRWTYGARCVFTNWAPDGPGSDGAAELDASTGQWNRVAPDQRRMFICKW